jgi:hypothetical protein
MVTNAVIIIEQLLNIGELIILCYLNRLKVFIVFYVSLSSSDQ